MNEPQFDTLETGEEQMKMPIADLVLNPLANFPDTDDCLCGSGHIWRRCHKSQMIKMIPKEQAGEIARFMKRYQQFLTQERNANSRRED
jgi:hypothetical protein